MGDKNKIDDLFSKGLGNFEASPNEDVWPKVKSSMEYQDRKKKAFYWRWASTAAALILAFYSGYYFNDLANSSAPKNTETTHQEHSQEVVTPINSNNGQKINHNQISADEESNPMVTPKSEVIPGAGNTGPSIMPDQTENVSSRSSFASITQPDQKSVEIALTSLPAKTNHFEQAIYMEEVNFPSGKALKGVNSEHYVYPTQPLLKSSESDFHYYTDNSRKNLETNQFSASLMAAPTFAFTDISVNEDNAATLSNIDQEQVNNSYAAGISVGYRTGQRWEIQSGVIINHWEQSASDILLSITPHPSNTITTNTKVNLNGNTSLGNVGFTGNGDPTSQGFVENSDFTDGSGNYALLPGLQENYQFIDIPLSIGYYLIDKRKWSFKVNGGINSRFLNSSDVKLVYANGEEENYENITLNDYSMQLIAGAGLGYNITQKIEFSLQPSLLYGITKVNKHQQVDTYFHQMLIYSALSYRF